jgi:hypothetical protein
MFLKPASLDLGLELLDFTEADAEGLDSLTTSTFSILSLDIYNLYLGRL